jgi:hypothetical protein
MTVTLHSRSTTRTWIAIAALVWNLLGLMMFVLQVSMSPAQVAALSAPERAVHEATPAWLNAAFGVAVVGGVLGSIGLLRRQRWAVACFAASLVAMAVQFAGAYAFTPAWQAFGVGGTIMPVVLLVIGAALLAHARRATA